MSAHKESQAAEVHKNVYLDPTVLVASLANERARPSETPTLRQERIKSMARSIAANGQEYPVLTIEVEDVNEQGENVVRYEYVDGGARVEAIKYIKTHPEEFTGTDAANITVWCSLVDPSADLYRRALISNMHRTQNSILDMAMIIQDIRERYGYKGRGGATQIAEFLGIQNSRVTEYDKILKAPKAIRERIESGEIASVDAALKLIDVPEPEQATVTVRASQLAKKEREEKAAKKGEPKPDPSKPAPIQSKHIIQAHTELKGGNATMTRSQIVGWVEGITGPAYGDAAHKWANYMLDKLFVGNGSDRAAYALFDAMLASKGGVVKPVKPQAKSVVPAKGKAPVKAAKKVVAKSVPATATATAKKTTKVVGKKAKAARAA